MKKLVLERIEAIDTQNYRRKQLNNPDCESELGKSGPRIAFNRVLFFVPEGLHDGYEKDEDGSECDWGTVLDWQPPTRVVFSWHLNGDFEYVTDISRASEVEVRLITEREGWTRVDLEHRRAEGKT